MRRLLLPAAVLAAVLLLPAVAAAKGPSGASISGPGLRHAISIEGNGEGDAGSALGILVSDGGFFAQAFEQTPSSTSGTHPTDRLGPRYDVTYTVPGPNGTSTLRQELYPYAVNGPATYMAPGQKFWETNSTPGGWYRGSVHLKRMLVKAGLPARAPTRKTARGTKIGVAIGAGAGVAAAAGLLALRYRRRSASG
jgi:opacity protein-like surface antigen